jgi:hypothetical protein
MPCPLMFEQYNIIMHPLVLLLVRTVTTPSHSFTSTQLNSIITSLGPLKPDFSSITTFLFTWCPSTSSLTYVCSSCMFIPCDICSNPSAGFWIKLLFISPFCQSPELCLRLSPIEHTSLYTLPCSLTAVKFSSQLLAPKRPTWLSATACLYLHSLSKKQILPSLLGLFQCYDQTRGSAVSYWTVMWRYGLDHRTVHMERMTGAVAMKHILLWTLKSLNQCSLLIHHLGLVQHTQSWWQYQAGQTHSLPKIKQQYLNTDTVYWTQH